MVRYLLGLILLTSTATAQDTTYVTQGDAWIKLYWNEDANTYDLIGANSNVKVTGWTLVWDGSGAINIRTQSPQLFQMALDAMRPLLNGNPYSLMYNGKITHAYELSTSPHDTTAAP